MATWLAPDTAQSSVFGNLSFASKAVKEDTSSSGFDESLTASAEAVHRKSQRPHCEAVPFFIEGSPNNLL